MLIYTDDTGALLGWFRLPGAPKLAVVGNRYIVAFEVSAPFMIGSELYTPEGTDTVIIEVLGNGQYPILGVVGGRGNQLPAELAAAADDAVAIMVLSTGALAFGATSWDTGSTEVRAVGVLGI